MMLYPATFSFYLFYLRITCFLAQPTASTRSHTARLKGVELLSYRAAYWSVQNTHTHTHIHTHKYFSCPISLLESQYIISTPFREQSLSGRSITDIKCVWKCLTKCMRITYGVQNKMDLFLQTQKSKWSAPEAAMTPEFGWKISYIPSVL